MLRFFCKLVIKDKMFQQKTVTSDWFEIRQKAGVPAMTTILQSRLRQFVLYGLILICANVVAIAQDVDPEEAKEKAIADRFAGVLEKNPRRGTALDKVYGFHVERGTLETLITSYRAKAEKLTGPESGTVYVIVGLLESLRGHDAAAVVAFEEAEKRAPQNYLACYYLGQSLVLIGNPDKAVEAFERAIERKPPQADLLDIYQTLGRVHQRAQKPERAMEIWRRLEKQFPSDLRVQEQIATTLLEESEFAAALPRYEALSKNTKDKYRQIQFQMEAAGLKVSLGRNEEGIKDFETLLGQLLPDSWIYRDVRRRIEGVYLRTDDQAGLIAYYENWVKTHADDLDAIARLARLLAGYGRSAESQEWLKKGLAVAPKSKDLRMSLINQLVYEQKFADAIAQYEQLDKNDPNDPDILRDWGRLILKETSQGEPERKKAAAAIWRRITNAKPKDPLVASQVGELFRQAGMTDEALELYRQAVALAPDQPHYREYLGEFLHSLKRTDEALAEWRSFAAGKLKTTANVARLSEVLASFGYLTEAVATNKDACQMDPKDYVLQVKQVDLLMQADKHDEALVQLEVVKKLAANDDERDAWLNRELRALQSLDRLTTRIAEVQNGLESGSAGDKTPATEKAAAWFWLANAYEVERQMKNAERAVTKASELSPESIPILKAAARIQDAQNNMIAAVETYTKLAAIDRRYRTDYLKQVATLEQKLGRKDRALQAGRDLIAAAPGNAELYEFYSQLCFQLGENDEGLNALRRSVRVNPSENKSILLLAAALADQFRTNEAIELYWRAFEKAGNLDERLDVVTKLTVLYLQINQFDRILERLERQRREPSQMREATICLANAYHGAGDDGNARQELERLLTEDTRDIPLLTQLVKLCEGDGDLEAAIKFQHQLLKSASGKEENLRLAQLLNKLGDTEEATAIVTRLTMEEKDPETVLKSLDQMLNQGNYENALQIVKKMTRDQSKNWELMYREGVALAKNKETAAEAKATFEAILALKIPDDELNLAEKSRAKKNAAAGKPSADRDANSITQRSQVARQIRQVVGLETNQNYYGSPPTWYPKDFGQARMGCQAWLAMLARSDGKEPEYIEARRAIGEKAESRRDILDWFYLVSVIQNNRDRYLVLKKLSQRPEADLATRVLYLNSLSGRGVGAGEVAVAIPADKDDDNADQKSRSKLPVLSKDELDHVKNCYRLANETEALRKNNQGTLQTVLDEMKRAGQKDEADKMLAETLDSAKSSGEIAALLSATMQRSDFKTALALLNRLAPLKHEWISAQYSRAGANNSGNQRLSADSSVQFLAQWMDKEVQKKNLASVLTLWDWYVPIAVTRNEYRNKAATSRRSQSQNNARGYVYVWRNGSNQYEQLDFPQPNEIYEQSSLQLLRQVYASYNDSDKMDELLQQFRQRLSSTTLNDAEKNFLRFGLGYLHWWRGDKDEALAALTEATGELPDNADLRLELARVHEKRGEHDLALEIIDSLPIADQQAMQRREITALRMAVNSGNIDRARQAAGRLFGLRLDSNLQIQLAQQMHQLGMHEQAEAVLGRAGRQAGNKTDVLASLMQQYQSQAKNDVATQIAYQLLQRSTARNPANRNNSNDGQSTRTQAFTILKRSGKLPDMIAKVESQLQHSPKSQRLQETLIEYYMANGDDKKAAEISSRLAETKQDDPQFRYNLAKQLMEQGKHAEAVAHFKIAFKKDSRLMRNDFWQIMNSFQSANKMEELASIFDEIDLKNFRQNPWEITNVISNLSNQDKSKDHAIKLFKRAWADLPDQRSQLLQNIHSEIFWQLPEFYDYAREGILPASESAIANNRWPGFGQVVVWGNQDGKIDTLLIRFLNLAATKGKFDELVGQIEATQKKVPDWEAAPTLLALIDLRRNKVDSVKPFFEDLLPTFKSARRGDYTQWEIAQELLSHESCMDLAVKYLEASQKDPNVMQMAQMNGFQYSPGRTLVTLYKRRGRKDEALRLLLDSTKQKSTRQQGNEAWEAYSRIQGATSLANEVKELGFPVDAIRLYEEQLARSEDFVVAVGVFGSGGQGAVQMEQMKKQLQNGLQTSVKQLRPEFLPKLLGARSDHANEEEKREPLDLMILLESRELDQTQLASVMGKLVGGLVKNRYLTDRTSEIIAESLEKRQDDLGLNILQALLWQSLGESDRFAKSLDQISKLADRMPLEAASAKGTFTSAQRSAAKPQVALWLVARDGLKQPDLKAKSSVLAERALEASRRLSDNGFSLAILREWGQITMNAGDKDGAARRWAEMLAIAIPKLPEKKTTKSADDDKKPAAQPPEAAKEPKSAPTAPKTTVVTLAQFEQASQIASLAAKNGLNDLSFTAMAQGLQSGPPIEAMVAIDFNQNPNQNNRNDNQASMVARKLQEQLTSLERVWRQSKAPEAAIYEALEKAVLPDSRPFEVFLYPQPVQDDNQQSPQVRVLKTPQNVGSLLVASAVKAGQTERLKQLIEPRLKQPLGELAGRVLLTQLSIAQKDYPAANEQLKALAGSLKQNSTKTSSELVSHVAIAALNDPALHESAANLMEVAIESLAQGRQPNRNENSAEPLRTYRIALARSYLRNQKPDAGKQQLDAYLATVATMYQNYGGDYGLYLRRFEFMKVAEEYARAGLIEPLFDSLGRYADLPVTNNYGNMPGYSENVMTALTMLPKENRYSLLRDWSMPTADRKSVRIVTGITAGQDAPARFTSHQAAGVTAPQGMQMVSTANLLVNAAIETGKLDELAQALSKLVEEKVEYAEFLLQMTRIAQGNSTEMLPEIEKLIENRKNPKKLMAMGRRNRVSNEQDQFVDGLIALAAVKNESLRPRARELLKLFMNANNHNPLISAVTHREYLTPIVDPHLVDQLEQEPWNSGLKDWTVAVHGPSGLQNRYDRTNSGRARSRSWWVAQNDILCKRFGNDSNHVFLNYPLLGEFEITCDVWSAGWIGNSWGLGYGGLEYEAIDQMYAQQLAYYQSQADIVVKPASRILQNAFNQVRMQVSGNSVRYFVNDDLVLEEQNPPNSSPWLFVRANGMTNSVIRNLKMTGAPMIPRSVSLIPERDLLGWSSDFYLETQPHRPLVDKNAEAENNIVPEQPADKENDWEVKDGVIQGRRISSTSMQATTAQSWLCYNRPLMDGERLEYEFWYQSGADAVLVHPALDRLAFLLEPEGVKLHWMTDGSSELNRYGLPSDNALVDPSIRKGPVTLNDNNWNKLELRLKDRVVSISVNGKSVAEVPLERDNGCQFGLYHDKNATSVQVRNVTLQGDWPASLPSQVATNLMAPVREMTRAERRGISQVIGEEIFAVGAEDLVLQTRGLPPEERFQALSQWVLPNDDHADLRFYGAFLSANAVPPSNSAMAVLLRGNAAKKGGRRQYDSPDAVAPILDLVAVATDLKRLDQLMTQTEPVAEDEPVVVRAKLGLKILVHIARKEFNKANAELAQFEAVSLPPELGRPANHVWPDYVVAQTAMKVPELRAATLKLLETIVDHQRKPLLDAEPEENEAGQPNQFLRSRGFHGSQLVAMRDECKSLLETNDYPAVGGSTPKGQWIQSRFETADAGSRSPKSRWQMKGDRVSHLAGDGDSYLYFQSPLRGTFTVTANVTTSPWTEPGLMYDGRWAGPHDSKKRIALGSMTWQTMGPKLEPPLELGEQATLKLDVTPQKITYSLNDRQVHERAIVEKPNPWLALISSGPNSGQVSEVRITGSPEIPVQVELMGGDKLAGWISTFYGDHMSNQRDESVNVDSSNDAWKKFDGELIGQKFAKAVDKNRLSLIRYHRPLAEDGELSYEFYYAKAETHVHPAIGRTAFVLNPTGVNQLWLGDNDSIRYGHRLDSETSEPSNRRGPDSLPLKDNDWNTLQLQIKGDQLKLILNGVEIYVTQLDSTNQREFGLFHYANQTDVRVRGVLYQGDWPKTLPDLNHQELSGTLK